MDIIDKILKKRENNLDEPIPCIVFFGDSVTQGCFELFTDTDGEMKAVCDNTSTYHGYLAKIFALLYPEVPVNFINSGIGGDNAAHALERTDRDVSAYKPDLTVVCFGLNDAHGGERALGRYIESLDKIFDKIKSCGSDIIFMTPNMMCTSISHTTTKPEHKKVCKTCMDIQNGGIMDIYMNAAKGLCRAREIPVCDCYGRWKTMHECGVNTTELLANKCNHPSREMNRLFAVSLAETIFGMHISKKNFRF